MALELRELEKKDYKKAIQFAIKGMHFDWYMDSELLLNLYGRYFWYLEMTKATQVIAAYDGERFLGVLLAEIKGEEKRYRSVFQSAYVKFFKMLQNIFVKGGVGSYDNANQEMYRQYCEGGLPDGEIIFLAADPESKIKGIGSNLLRELERREPGKKIYLYTDNACTYQFYEHRGFTRVGEREIIMELGGKTVELQCFLYSKMISERTDSDK